MESIISIIRVPVLDRSYLRFFVLPLACQQTRTSIFSAAVVSLFRNLRTFVVLRRELASKAPTSSSKTTLRIKISGDRILVGAVYNLAETC